MTTVSGALAARPRLGTLDNVGDLLSRPGVLTRGHYQLLGGAHTDTFVAFSRIACDDSALDTIANWSFGAIASWEPTLVLAPSTAGVGLASTIARKVSARLLLADLDDAGRPCGVLGDSIYSNARVLLVNDVVTTGAGLAALARIARDAGASVAGATWFLSRSTVDVAKMLAAPTVHTVDLVLRSWASTDCPLCEGDASLQRAIDLN